MGRFRIFSAGDFDSFKASREDGYFAAGHYPVIVAAVSAKRPDAFEVWFEYPADEAAARFKWDFIS